MTRDTPDVDEKLRELLRKDRVSTSPEHDAAVLSAARAFTARPASGLRRRRMAIPLAMAASLAVVSVGVYLKYGAPLPDDGTVRSGTNIAATAVVPANGVTLVSFPDELQWPEQAGARFYQVVLRDAAGEPIWRSPNVELNHVPVAVVERDPATRTYYWTVEVAGAGGTRELGPFWFRLQ